VPLASQASLPFAILAIPIPNLNAKIKALHSRQ